MIEKMFQLGNSEYFFIGGVFAAGCLWLFTKKYVFPRDFNPRKRKLSFSSEAMLTGAFPHNAKVWEPIINVLFYFKTVPSVEKMKHIVEELFFYDRFRSVVLCKNGEYSFVDLGPEDQLCIEKDIIKTVVLDTGDNLMEKVDSICNTDFDSRERVPLWRMIRLVNEHGKFDGLLIRVHHSIGDGISLIGTMAKIFTSMDGSSYSINVPEKAGGGSQKYNIKAMNWISSFIECAMLPNTPFDSDIKFTAPNKENLEMTSTRRTIELPTLKLDFYKALKNAAGMTINDVMLALTTGMIRRYCDRHNDPLFAEKMSGVEIQNRVLMPVAFPRPKVFVII